MKSIINLDEKELLSENCKKLADIICDFRCGEIEQIDEKHVKRWIEQFDKDFQLIILEEMIYVFSDWYLTRDYIVKEYLDKIPGILQKKYGFISEADTCRNVVFVNTQSVGRSQRILISELKHLKQEQYGILLKTDIDSTFSHYVYIDDGFYSGSRARKDIKEIAYQLKPGDTLDVFFLVLCTSGFLYAKNEFMSLEAECKIDIKFHPLTKIDNERREHVEYKDGIETIWWMKNHMSLWPDIKLRDDAEINAYYEYLQTVASNYEKYPYRNSHWINDSGVFSSVERRSVVEKEFLKKGIQIAKAYPNNKGMYPLGYNLWPSFGFGVLFATDFNVPNNAPLVIWADTNWYPLLPRRLNNQDDVFEVDEGIDLDVDYSDSDQYNMCPDCGKFFGFDEDGGNGFCIDCAWEH